jgi:hypothetical protein
MFRSAEETGFQKTRAVGEDEPAINLLVRLSNRKQGLKGF